MMDKTININISGTLFQIDEDAFRVLHDYLLAINNRFRNIQGGLETVEDIESRIAEIFQSQRGLAGAITMENVEAMIAVIGKPEDFDIPGTETDIPVYSTQKKRMHRNPDDKIAGGVCGGIGAYLNTDPVLFRILFVLFTMFGGIGIFIYIALWIALPLADTDSKKREMYGGSFNKVMSKKREADGTYRMSAPSYDKGYYNSGVGNAFNEIFRAIGRVLYIIMRIFLICFGIIFVLTGFLCILAFVLILVFKFPGSYSSGSFDMNLTYFSDFLKYVVNPSLVPWIIALTLLVLILPMLALIYWGVKMIFWFKAKEGLFSLVGFVLWITIIAILAVILFNEGISFADTAKSSALKILSHNPDTLYVKSDKKISDLIYDKNLSFSDNGYNILISDEKKELYISPYLKAYDSEKDNPRVEVKKRSSGRNEVDALKKTEDLIYNYDLKGDTLILDEYFTIPVGRKWAADNIGINIYLHEGTVLKFDGSTRKLLHVCYENANEDSEDSEALKINEIQSWAITKDGLVPAIKSTLKRK
jgi:phage shock protein PspC (stress-responsive transcriptional regulator)